MKKLILSIITLFLFSALGLAQYQDTLRYDNGQIQEIRTYNNSSGELNGKSIQYFKDGTLAAVVNYKDGLKNGFWHIWHPNGELAYKLHYKNEERIGTWRGYDKKSDLFFVKKY